MAQRIWTHRQTLPSLPRINSADYCVRTEQSLLPALPEEAPIYNPGNSSGGLRATIPDGDAGMTAGD